MEDKAPAPWNIHGRVSLVVTSVLGIAYAAGQFFRSGKIDDPMMIVLVVVNVTVVYGFGLFIARRLDDMFVAFGEAPDRAPLRVAEIMGHRFAPVFGLGYAAVFGAAAWFIDPWQGATSLRLLLAAFIFAGSFFIGVAVFAIFLYWRAVLRALPGLDLRILTLSRPPLLPLLKVNSLIVTTTAAIACSAITAAVFSKFELESEAVIAFSVFTLAIAVLTYAVPILPLSNLLRLDKAREIDRVDRLIEAHVRRLTDRPDRADGAPLPGELPGLGELKEVRALLTAIRTLPPGGQVSVSAAAIVALLSFLPSLLEYGKNWLLP